MNKSLTLFAFITAKPGMQSDLKISLQKLIKATLQEDGCVEYRLMQEKEALSEFILIEKWIDESSWKTHMEEAHVKEFLSKMNLFVASFKGRSFIEIKNSCTI